jgi:DNA-binding Xre family transcriptional regulator
MIETLKNNVEKLLKEQRKTKRDLAKLLKIKENSVNRTLTNPSIALSKVGIIADFLEVEIYDLLPKKEPAHENMAEYLKTNPLDAANQTAVDKLSDSVHRLVQFITENLSEKKNLNENIFLK